MFWLLTFEHTNMPKFGHDLSVEPRAEASPLAHFRCTNVPTFAPDPNPRGMELSGVPA